MNEDQPAIPMLTRPEPTSGVRTAEQKAEIIEYALTRMEDGDSLEHVGRDLGINPGTLWGWLNAENEAKIRYERAKITRARGFIERAIDEIQHNPDFKAAESRARTYLKLAAILNPSEFSDKMHTGMIRSGAGAGKGLTFNLTFTSGEQTRVLTAIAQPEDGELP